MEEFDPYIYLIGASLLVALSYFFDIMSKKLKTPSVLFLILVGIALKNVAQYYDIHLDDTLIRKSLQILGIVGLIIIVLEAALDLKISRSNVKIIRISLFLALVVLILSSFSIAGAIMYLRDEPFFNSLVYAIPLSVVSSAVLIPSVHTLTQSKKEFLIYESTFSDIIGIMFFNFIVLNEGDLFSGNGLINIGLTVVLSVALSYFLVYLFCRIKTHIKLFLMLSFLALLYSIGKEFHMSSLLMIFIFGITLNNARRFFKGVLKKTINLKIANSVKKEFKIITGETAFLIRTFFFIAFGLFIDLEQLLDFQVLSVGSVIVVILYLVRYINFKLFTKTDVFPEIFLAPRGLITILLFFSIPFTYQIHDFPYGILFFVILTTSVVMMIALIATPNNKVESMTIIDYGLSPTDKFSKDGSEPYGGLDDVIESEKKLKALSKKMKQ